MRILYHHRVRSKDGQYVHIEELIAAFRRRGHEVVLMEPEGTRRARFGDEAGAVAWLKRGLPKAIYELLELAYGLGAAVRLYRAWRASRPDLLYERYNLHLPAGLLLRRLTGIPFLLEVNAPLAEERARHDGLALPWLARLTERLIWRGADRVLVVTERLAERVIAAGVPPARVEVVPNGIDLQRFSSAPTTAAAKAELRLGNRLVLGFVGFVRPWHGLERVLDWMHARPDGGTVLLLVGDGPARAGLVARAAALGLTDRLRITGIVEREQVPRYIAAFDIALQPAVVDYASPLKLFEYMALGRAILAPDAANIREILADGENALLASPADLTPALDRLAGDLELRRRLGEAARATIIRRDLTWDGNARRIERLCRKVPIVDPGSRGSRHPSSLRQDIVDHRIEPG